MVINTQDTNYSIAEMVINTKDTNYSIRGIVINTQDTNYFIRGMLINTQNERLKFAAAYGVPSARPEATGGNLFTAEGMLNCDLIIIAPSKG